MWLETTLSWSGRDKEKFCKAKFEEEAGKPRYHSKRTQLMQFCGLEVKSGTESGIQVGVW